MREVETEILGASEVRRSLTVAGDIQGEVAFQNDLNALLARFEHLQVPWRSLSDLYPPPIASGIVADTTPLPLAALQRAAAPIPRLAPLVVQRVPARVRQRG